MSSFAGMTTILWTPALEAECILTTKEEPVTISYISVIIIHLEDQQALLDDVRLIV